MPINKTSYPPRTPTQRHKKTFKNKKRAQPSNNKTILCLFNKPFNTLCQFTGEEQDLTLANFIKIKDIYPAGRLDKDSEGLLLLTNNGKLQNKISHPQHKMEKTYWVQVEGEISDQAIEELQKGVKLKDGRTKQAKAKKIDIDKQHPQLWKRDPPVRFRKNIATSWVELSIKEGKNRQVRRMTAATGYPTLRLIRMSIGPWSVSDLKPGEYKITKSDKPSSEDH